MLLINHLFYLLNVARNSPRHVRRSWQWQRDGSLQASVGSVDEQAAQQAGTGDLLLLKGHAWSGNYGATGWRGGTHPCWRTSGKGGQGGCKMQVRMAS